MNRIALCIGLALMGCQLHLAAADKAPNIVFILVDDMGWNGLSTAMDPEVKESLSDFYKTPNIDQLAGESVVFSRAYSPGPSCSPSRAGILTGKTPAELHMTTPGAGATQPWHKVISADFVRVLPEAEVTIGDRLKKQGYATAHFGKWHLGRSNPGDHGFDVHDGSTGNEGGDNTGEDNPKDIFGITSRGLEFMEKQAKARKPFYLQLSHYAVHEPVAALASSVEKFGEMSIGQRHDKVDFAAMTFDFDTSVGQVLEKVRELKLEESTYIVFMSDNGAVGNQRRPVNAPLAFGKGTLYEGGIRVPLMIRGPGIKGDTYCDEKVTGCDLLPTFCEWVGTAPGEIEGSSLVPLLSGNPSAFKRPQEGLLFHNPHYGAGPIQKPQTAILVRNYKLLRDLETGTDQLFDLESDISESTDLAQKKPEIAADMAAVLEKRLEQVGAQMPTPNPDYDPEATAPRGGGKGGKGMGKGGGGKGKGKGRGSN
ncbi:MAG: sulfatase [Verrucomicrobiales bacterium]|nr:sulfatase [Verrucomicrobiales bacterium]